MLWLKALHLIFMVTWFAGLFYLPRLFVYHADSEDEISLKRFQIMECKLFWGIMTPGAILTLIFGGYLFAQAWQTYIHLIWMQGKISLILLLLGYHLWCGILVTRFKHGKNCHSSNWYRWFNEIPVIALVGTILLAVIKPYG